MLCEDVHALGEDCNSRNHCLGPPKGGRPAHAPPTSVLRWQILQYGLPTSAIDASGNVVRVAAQEKQPIVPAWFQFAQHNCDLLSSRTVRLCC
jgi:hypothetical protein